MPRVSQDHLEARRRQILDGARACFARHGYEGATVRRLEEATGLSRGAIFHHFRDKESLFIAVAEDDAAAMTQRVPEYGFHLDCHRKATFVVDVQAELDDLAEWGALAKLVGESHQNYFAVPVFTGINRAPSADELKHLGASLASYGSMAMFHMVGFTPEASTLDAALANLAAAIEESNAEIVRPTQPLPRVIGDPTLLTMLWQNLIANAMKFRHVDRAPRIVIDFERHTNDRECLLTVSDNGIGIAEEFTDKVFVIFQRLHGRDVYPGTGVGLALVKKIIEYHGGAVRIDTTYTEGTRFELTLPVPVDVARPATLQGAQQ